MKLHILTIVLDGMPFIPYHLPMLQSSLTDWHWHVVHGAAMNKGSTSWCNLQEPRLSLDGTTEYLEMIKCHPRVTVYERASWNSKDEMVNEPLKNIHEECVLMQIDSDEIWRVDHIEALLELFQKDEMIKSIQGGCRYFLGVNIISTSRNGYGNNPGEWLRLWRFTPGDKFDRHEPPQLKQAYNGINFITLDSKMFDHYAWWSESQVAYKERFYGYPNAVEHWRKLQANTKWPVADLSKFLPWVGKNASADKVI